MRKPRTRLSFRWVRLGWLLALTLVGSSCRPPETASLRIGINDWPGYEFLYLAQAKGYFEAEGLNVRLVEFNSLADAARAFERGQVDGLGCTLVEMLVARARSPRDPVAVYTCDYSSGADVILAQPEFPELKQLHGKRVGVELGSLGAFLLARALESAGLRIEDLQIVSSDQVTMEDAFRKRELDAVVTYPPFSVRLGTTPGIHTLFRSSAIPGEIVDVLALERSVIQNQPRAARALVRGFARAQEFYAAQPEDAAVIMGARERLGGPEFHAALTTGISLVPRTNQAEYLAPGRRLEQTAHRIEQTLRATRQLPGAIRTNTPLATEELVPASLP